MNPPTCLLAASLALAWLALLRAIEWPPPDLRLLRLWKLAGRQTPLTARRWLRLQLLSCGTARWRLNWQAARRERQIKQELPLLADCLCIALGCGLSWPAALQLAAQTPAGSDICSLLQRRTLLTPAPLAPLARELRHSTDALDCLLRWSHDQGIAAYDLRHEATGSGNRVGDPGFGGLQWRRAADDPGHA